MSDREENLFPIRQASVLAQNCPALVVELLQLDEAFALIFEQVPANHVHFRLVLEITVDLVGDNDRNMVLACNLSEIANLDAELLIDGVDVVALAYLETVEHRDRIEDDKADALTDEAAEPLECFLLLLERRGIEEDCPGHDSFHVLCDLGESCNRERAFRVDVDRLFPFHEIAKAEQAEIGLPGSCRTVNCRDGVSFESSVEKFIKDTVSRRDPARKRKRGCSLLLFNIAHRQRKGRCL